MGDKFKKCCWYFGACLLATVAVIGIVLFYLTLGCAYELVKCYLKDKKAKEQEEKENEEKMQYNLAGGDSQHNQPQNINYNLENYRNDQNIHSEANKNNIAEKKYHDELSEEEHSEYTNTEWCIMVMIGISGFLLQPVYLMFYILYGIMECYRRFNCWFYYAGG